MANWWDDAPVAEDETPQAQGNWWEAAPAEQEAPPMSAFEERMRSSPAAGMNPYAEQPATGPSPMRASTRLPQTVTEDQYPALRAQAEQTAQGDKFVQARRTGIEAGGAPDEIRRAYMQMTPEMRGQYSEYMVNQYFSKKSDGNADPVPVQFSESVGTHIFRDPDDGTWKPLNDLGVDWEDAREFMRYVGAPVGAAVGAGIGATAATGMPFVGGAAALAADAGTSMSMRRNDIASLLEKEFLPPDINPNLEGAKEGLWAVGGAAVGGAAGKVIRRAATGVDDIPMAVQVDRKTIDSLLKRYENEYGDHAPNLTLDEKMSLVAETPTEKAAALRVRSRKETLQISAETRKDMLERQIENKEAFANGLDEFMQVVGKGNEPGVFRSSGLSADELLDSSTRIINTLDAQAKAKLAQYDHQLARAYQDADRTVDEILDGASDPQRLPESFANVFTAARENFKANMGEKYDEIGAATRGQRVFDITPVKDQLNTLRQSLQEDAKFREAVLGENVSGLTLRPDIRIGSEAAGEADDDVAEVFLGTAFTQNTSDQLLDDAGRRAAADNTMFGYKEVDKALGAVRERIRRLPQNISPRTRGQLQQLEETLEAVRLEGLEKIDPELASSQSALDSTYKLGLDALDRSIGKKLAKQYLAPRPGMDGLLKPSTFEKLFKGDAGAETARDIRTLMDMDVVTTGPSNPVDMLGVVDNTRRGLLGELRRRTTAVAGEGGQARVVTPEAFQQFKSEYKDALELAFSPEQVSKMENMTSLRNALERAEASHKAVKEKVSQMPWGSEDLANDPAQLIRKTWGPADDATKLQRSRELRQALREQGDPDGLISDYRKLIAHDMMTNITDKQTGTIDPFKLDDYLARHQEQLAEWYTTRRDNKSGTALVDNLKAYSEIGKSIMGNAGLNHADADPMMRALNSFARAYVGVFTTAGRVLTAGKQLGGGASLSKEADFVLNPRKYIKNEAFYEVLDGPTVRGINRAGGHMFINDLREARMEEAEQRAEAGEPQPLF